MRCNALRCTKCVLLLHRAQHGGACAHMHITHPYTNTHKHTQTHELKSVRTHALFHKTQTHARTLACVCTHSLVRTHSSCCCVCACVCARPLSLIKRLYLKRLYLKRLYLKRLYLKRLYIKSLYLCLSNQAPVPLASRHSSLCTLIVHVCVCVCDICAYVHL